MQQLKLAKEGRMNPVKGALASASASLAMAQLSMMAMAADNPFAGANTAITEIVGYAKDMMLGLVTPLAALACLVAICVMYLPGQSTKTVDRCKSVIWTCIATVVLSYALTGIFNIAKTIGQSIA